MKKIHELKIHPKFFDVVNSKHKNFEIRKNDRNFTVGDTVILKEYCPDYEVYTGATLKREITYITNYNQKPEYVVFGIKQIKYERNNWNNPSFSDYTFINIAFLYRGFSWSWTNSKSLWWTNIFS